MSKENRDLLKQLIGEIPKTEIHLHLEAMCTVDTVWALMNKNHLVFEGISSREDIEKKFVFKSLDDFISLFIDVIQNCFQNTKDFEYLINDACSYFLKNNIVYSEVFFSPTKFLKNGLNFRKIIKVLEQGAKDIYKKHKIEIKFIIDVSRGFGLENAMHNLDLTIKHRSASIIGIGLGGSEISGPARDFKAVFDKAHQYGLKTVAHAGEDVGPESVWDALKILKAERIGHGISSIQDPELIEYLKTTQIPLEVCPTSNVLTKKFVTSLQEHPIRELFDKGVYVTLNTDDPTLFNIDLVQEYMNLHDYLGFSAEELFKLLRNNIFATSLPIEDKDALWKTTHAIIKKAGFTC